MAGTGEVPEGAGSGAGATNGSAPLLQLSGVGIQFGITAIGAAISPALFGMIADAYDLYTGFYFLAGTIACANLLIFFMPNGEATQTKPVTAS